MNNVLAGLTTDNTVKEDGDFLGGFSLLESDVYEFTIEHAYVTQSDKGATAVNLSLVAPGNTKLETAIYVSSGKEKGCKNYYIKKDKQGVETKHYLPGFNQINSMCLMTAGAELSALSSTCEEKVLELYDYDQKRKVPTKVSMIMGLIGHKIKAGVIKQIVDKNVKDATGKYVPSGETREENEIDKMFRASDNLTVNEIKDGKTEAVFMAAWLEKWKGNVKNKAKKTGAVAGAPTQGAPTAGAPAAAKPLFAPQG